MELFDNHRKLFRTATLVFVGLTLLVAIIPAMKVQRNNAPPPGAVPLSEDARKGKAVFIAEGCVACHTQQVRNVDMDKVWGERPGIAADYADIHRTDFWRNTATLMGTERTGPDLTNVGVRQPSLDWNLSHLFNPRIVVKESVMPAYPWLIRTPVTSERIGALMSANRTAGVPYTDEMIAAARADFRAQADPDAGDVGALMERYPKAVARNFDGQPGVSELDALIAYLQMLGTLVDFSTYTPVPSR